MKSLSEAYASDQPLLSTLWIINLSWWPEAILVEWIYICISRLRRLNSHAVSSSRSIMHLYIVEISFFWNRGHLQELIISVYKTVQCGAVFQAKNLLVVFLESPLLQEVLHSFAFAARSRHVLVKVDQTIRVMRWGRSKIWSNRWG